MDEERMRPGHWLGLVLCVPLDAFLLMVGCWEDCKKPIPLISRGSLPEQVEEGDPSVNWLTQVHLEWKNDCYISGSSNISQRVDIHICITCSFFLAVVVWLYIFLRLPNTPGNPGNLQELFFPPGNSWKSIGNHTCWSVRHPDYRLWITVYDACVWNQLPGSFFRHYHNHSR